MRSEKYNQGGNTIRGGTQSGGKYNQGGNMRKGENTTFQVHLLYTYTLNICKSKKSIQISNSPKFVSRWGPLSSIQFFNPNSIWINAHWEIREILPQRRFFCTNFKFRPKNQNMHTTSRSISIPSPVHLVTYSLRYKRNTSPNAILFHFSPFSPTLHPSFPLLTAPKLPSHTLTMLSDHTGTIHESCMWSPLSHAWPRSY